MKQYKASYLIEPVWNQIQKLLKDESKNLRVNGLLQSLSTFDVFTNLNLEKPSDINPVYAVANNIITKGTPTLPSIIIENWFQDKFKISTLVNDSGTLTYNFIPEYSNSEFNQSIFEALHIIDPRAKDRNSYLYLEDTDSRFERSFLQDYIPQNKFFLAQLFQHQRRRNTLGAEDNNQGRVDFSVEIPYALNKQWQNRFHNEVNVKFKQRFIVEVDGARYHTKLYDDIKDFQIAQLPNHINHIREGNAYNDIRSFLNSVLNNEYIKIIEKNYNIPYDKQQLLNTLVLSPIAIARIQKTILEYLISNETALLSEIKIAVIERDVPCGQIAIDDLNTLLKNINALSSSNLNIPDLSVHVVSFDKNVELNEDDFDLILDVSVLRRSGVFKDDMNLNEKNIVIRSSHHILKDTYNTVYSAPLIKYKQISIPLSNERHESIIDSEKKLTYFLQNIFRKEKFREGQLPILNRALHLQSVIGLLPTGGGKSLTYQLASLLQPGITIVIDPIRSLMVDQYNGLKKVGIDKCDFLNSTLSTAHRLYNQNELLVNGCMQFMFVSPERLVIKEFREALTKTNLNGFYFSYCVIDEVHCVSEWGHDFRTPYLNLGENAIQFCKTKTNDPITLFGLTATASFDVLADIERELHIPNDDGHSVIRYENTVRNEINYTVNLVKADFTGMITDNNFEIKRRIGAAKQAEALNYISELEKEISKFNNEIVLEEISSKAFDEYLSDEDKFKKEGIKDSYIKESLNKMILKTNWLKENGENSNYNYGIILFCPHRTGSLGVKDSYNRINEELEKERPGYFMGSSEGQNAELIDKESFNNLEKFVNNEVSVMVATKAFGMGIDKPNIRLTIHMNVPQSIESFVQEAGRAGRDQKVSIASILYNNEKELDKEVLDYFHKRAFKGETKERQVIYELRTRITFPNTTNLNRLNEEINETFNNDQYNILIQLGNNNWANYLFVKTSIDQNIGSINLQDRETRILRTFDNYNLAQEILETIDNRIPWNQLENVNQRRQWLTAYNINTNYEIGIETALNDMNLGEHKEIQISFINKFYSKPTRQRDQFRLNRNHYNLINNIPIFKQLVESGVINEELVFKKLEDAIYNNLDYEEFINSLTTNDDYRKILKDDFQLQRAYLAPRGPEDTSKGIYRLISVGIIDTYTIDYNNKLFNVSFTKKGDDAYFNALRKLFMRYTSEGFANREIEKVKNEYIEKQRIGKGTVISICLKHLTSFVYNKIQKKRAQAIDDIIGLCERAIQNKDYRKQNLEIKDEIYYYFNAKYSRDNNTAKTEKDGIEEDIKASLIEDRENNVDFHNTIWKYIDITEIDTTGEFKNNVKHLRGASQRMLRSFPEEPHYLILKSYSLFILSDTIKILLDEAKREFVNGVINWKAIHKDFVISEFIKSFKDKLDSHIKNFSIDEIFEEIEENIYVEYYADWLNQFNDKFITH